MKAKTLFLVLVAVLLLAPAAYAIPLTGSLTSPAASGVVATAQYDNGGFTIAWNVTEEAPIGGFKVFDYDYTITTTSKTLSHIILQVSDNFTAADIFDVSAASVGPASGDPQTYSSAGPGDSNPNMPNPIFGLKFQPTTTDTGPYTYEINFDSFRAPVAGNFYAKDGQSGSTHIDVTAWNTGLDGGTDFIAVPDSKTVVPVPPSVLLLGSGFLGLGALRFRKGAC